MRVPGYCEKCHRPKLVNAGSRGLVSGAVGGVVLGICDPCQERLDIQRSGVLPPLHRQRALHGWAFRNLDDETAAGLRRYLASGRLEDLPADWRPVITRYIAAL